MLAACSYLSARAADAPQAPLIGLPDLNRAFEQLPMPITNFINSARQISVGISNGSTPITFNQADPGTLFTSLDAWFSNVTGGVRLSDVLRPLGNFLAWFFSTIADLIRRVVALL